MNTKQNIFALVIASLSFAFLSACDRASFDPLMLESVDMTPSSDLSSLSVTNENIADGMTPADVLIEIKNQQGTPVPNFNLNLSVSGTENVIVPCPKSDRSGISRCKVYSTKAELKTIIVTFGAKHLWKNTMFKEPRPFRSLAAFVSAGNVQNLPSGAKIVASAGLNETGAVGKDSFGITRIHSTVHGSIIGD